MQLAQERALREATVALSQAAASADLGWKSRLDRHADEYQEALSFTDVDLDVLAEASFVPSSTAEYLNFLCTPQALAECTARGHQADDLGLCNVCSHFVGDRPRARWLWQFRIAATVARAQGVSREQIEGLLDSITEKTSGLAMRCATQAQVLQVTSPNADSRADPLTQYAKVYVQVSKRDKSMILDEVSSLMGWSRSHARRELCRLATIPAGTPVRQASPRFSVAAREGLEMVWRSSGNLSGRILSESMPLLAQSLVEHGHLELISNHDAAALVAELERMSAATIDRHVRDFRSADRSDGDKLLRSMFRFLLRSRARTENSGVEPGELKLRIHRSRELHRLRTVLLIDEATGWISASSGYGGDWSQLEFAFTQAMQDMPFQVTWVNDIANCLPETVASRWLINSDLMVSESAVASAQIARMPSIQQPAHEHDIQALTAINRLWSLLSLRLNFFTRYVQVAQCRSAGPRTPTERLLGLGVLSEQEVRALRERQARTDIHAVAVEAHALASASQVSLQRARTPE